MSSFGFYMEIRNATINDIEAMVRYQCKMFPERSAEQSEWYMRLWSSKAHDEISNSFLVLDDNGEICGQDLYSSMNYYYGGEKADGVWEFDLIIDEALRKDTWGLDLLVAGLQHEHIFATGSNDTALKIHNKMGKRWLGELRKYVKVVNPLYIATALWRGNVPAAKFPAEVASWRRVAPEEFPQLTAACNPSLFEVGRDIDFLRWRFTQLHEYAVYRREGGDEYFVVRTIIKSHITALVIVDWRCRVEDDGSRFEQIVEAATAIAKSLHLPILITGSSLAATDAVLERHRFRSVGRPRPIIGNDKRFKQRKDDIARRAFALVTLADSDGEVFW